MNPLVLVLVLVLWFCGEVEKEKVSCRGFMIPVSTSCIGFSGIRLSSRGGNGLRIWGFSRQEVGIIYQ